MVFRRTLLLLVVAGITCSVGSAQQDLGAKGRAFVTAIFSDNPETAVAMMDETMAKAMPVNVLRQFREQLTANAGHFQSIRDVRVEPIQNYQAAYVGCAFEKTNLNLRVVFDSDAKVAGLQVVP